MTASPAEVVRDFYFHPGEPFARRFPLSRPSVLRLDDDAFVAETGHGDLVLRHYAFASEWFKVNVTLDRQGQFIKTPSGPDHAAFAFNCDIATPMRRSGCDIFAVDLFADVLVEADGRSASVKDEADLPHAAATGLISRCEFASARIALDRLMALIDAGSLIALLEAACPFGSSHAPDAFPMTRVPLAGVPEVQPERRWSWLPPT